MRKTFASVLHEEMTRNPNIYLLFADVGYGILDKIREDFPDRAINTGAAEQLMIGMAVGLAQEGKIPVCYTITPFLLYRPFEFIRNFVNHENLNIKLVGSGRDKDYSKDGFTHWSQEDHEVMKLFPNIVTFYPDSATGVYYSLKNSLEMNKPCYINLARSI